jgi:hypothetical protein
MTEPLTDRLADPRASDALFRRALGPNLMTGTLRALLALAGFAVIGTLLALIIR